MRNRRGVIFIVLIVAAALMVGSIGEGNVWHAGIAGAVLLVCALCLVLTPVRHPARDLIECPYRRDGSHVAVGERKPLSSDFKASREK